MWITDNDGNPHLENAVLLAYTRGQLAADVVLTVQQHCTNCTRCTQKCADYTHIGAMLQQNLTYIMPVYPSIMDMLGDALDSPAAASTALRQRGENKSRIRKQSASISGAKALRLFPGVGVLPLTVSVSLVMLMILLAYMLSGHMNILAIKPPVGNGPVGPSTSSTGLPALPTATQTPTQTRTVSTSSPGTSTQATPGGTTSPKGSSKPVIWICSSNADLAQSRLRICGKNFKAGDKVLILEVFANIGRKWGVWTTVDAHGTISGAWTIQNCHSVPVGVFAFDETRGLTTQVVPVNVSLGGCHSPNGKSGGH
jgi:hypothetical protein